MKNPLAGVSQFMFRVGMAAAPTGMRIHRARAIARCYSVLNFKYVLHPLPQGRGSSEMS